MEAQAGACCVDHRVEARVEGDLAHLTVYRTFHNARPRYIEMFDWLELPRQGTVHGFAFESQGQWTEGTLLAASEAQRRYEALRGKGRAAPRTIAKLSASQDAADLYIWNLPPRASVTLVLRGLRWGCPSSTPVEIDPTLSADLGRHAHAWSITSSMARSGDDAPPPPEAVELLAKTGDWLSPDRSFLAVPPGAGPSSSRTRSLSGWAGGSIHSVIGDTISCPAGMPSGRADDPKFGEELTKLLRPALAACLKGGTNPAIQVRVETTGDELVDVDVTGAASEAQAACVREATWALRLPPLFDDGLQASYTLTPSP